MAREEVAGLEDGVMRGSANHGNLQIRLNGLLMLSGARLSRGYAKKTMKLFGMCICGHIEEEHDRGCNAENCRCVGFEAYEDEDEEAAYNVSGQE